jgi:hypothetical protein
METGFTVAGVNMRISRTCLSIKIKGFKSVLGEHESDKILSVFAA